MIWLKRLRKLAQITVEANSKTTSGGIERRLIVFLFAEWEFRVSWWESL